MARSVLLSMLADGEFRSGQDLAQALGVSRTAVWKQLNKLAEECGLEVESVKGKGYRIAGGIDLLDEADIRRQLTPRATALMADLSVLDSIDSTNAEMLRCLEQGAMAGAVCTAESQSAGRGRRGRTWVSPYASNIYLSLAWEYSQGAAALEGLSLAVGVAVVQALADAGIEGAQLKWPNDILHEGAKLGGVLLEMTGDAAGACQVVVGVGLNVAMPARAANDIDQAWTDLRTLCAGSVPPRSYLLSQLLNQLLPLLADFEAGGFASWRERWQTLDAFAGEPVVLSSGEHRVSGRARGVDDRGALQLETSSGIQSMYGGEISLRADK
jgi:BirA family transcriptional regulator, biotin operon repressor / biotin---[acetyl-CoA-carboxylase] ligase